MNAFFDASALIKRYVDEAGSDRVQEILSVCSSLALCVICLPEVLSGLCRLRRERRLSPQHYAEIKRALVRDAEDSTLIHITDQVIVRTFDLLERWPLRSSDALHVACAAEWGADVFVSADQRQCDAARAYGLRVETLR